MTQRRKRQRLANDKLSVEELRVVKKQRPTKAERVAVGPEAKRPAWEVRLRALLKTNKRIKDLASRADQGDDLNDHQKLKLQRRDAVLLEIDAILVAHPDAADRLNQRRRAA